MHRIEKINKELRERIYDYETFFRKISHIYESKNIDLAESAKDIINMKKRIANLNDLNEDIERENDYLRISFHLLYVIIRNKYLYKIDRMKCMVTCTMKKLKSYALWVKSSMKLETNH